MNQHTLMNEKVFFHQLHLPIISSLLHYGAKISHSDLWPYFVGNLTKQDKAEGVGHILLQKEDQVLCQQK
jgi:hypothetical protein